MSALTTQRLRSHIEPKFVHAVVVVGGRIVADSRETLVLIEGQWSALYFPPHSVDMKFLSPGKKAVICESKGLALFYDLLMNRRRVPNAAWTYPHPTSMFEDLRNHISFDPRCVDRLIVENRQIAASKEVRPG